MRNLLAVAFSILLPTFVQAQDTSDPLTVPFATFPPFLYFDNDGQRAGFIVDLAEAIGEEIGVEIAYLDVAGTREWIAAQNSGQSQFIPGVTRLPVFEATNVFSDEVAADVLRPVVRASDEMPSSDDRLEGLRIGIVPPAMGSEEPILEQNIPVEFGSPQNALIGLLSSDVDALLVPPQIIYQLALDAGVDGRIAFLDTTLRTTTRHVAIHESRAELLGPINDAIARLEASGWLEEARQRHNLVVPEPPPQTLIVGINHAPPYGIIGTDGSISGFSADLWRELARRANLNVEFEGVPSEIYSSGPSTAVEIDAMGTLLISEQRAERMDFTLPVQQIHYQLFFRQDNPPQAGVSPFADRRIGVLPQSLNDAALEALAGTDIVFSDSIVTLVDGVMDGTYDAVLTVSDLAQQMFVERGVWDQVAVNDAWFFTQNIAPALRPGLGAVRERLNAVIPGFLLSDEYALIEEQYFGEPVFWTARRVVGGMGAMGALILALAVMLVWQTLRQRQQTIAFQSYQITQEKAQSAELGKLVTELERSNRELDEFAYIASHDLKEPLRGIGINATFLREENLPGKVGERVARMAELAGRMDKLVSDLFHFSRLGRAEDAQEVVTVSEVIADVRSDLREWLAERNAEIIEETAIPTLMAEPSKVKTVLQNLVVNGVKYNDSDRKTVAIGFMAAATVNDKSLQNAIYVKDNGIGIDEQHRAKVFRIFSRLHKEADYGGGSGSGLAFVRKIVEETGGIADFSSEPGAGTTFFLTLPLAPGDEHSGHDRGSTT